MMDDVRRGRKIIGAYATIHLTFMAIVVVVSLMRGWPWQRMLVRALTQTAFIHSLWRGSRWSQWLHVIGFVGTAAVFLMLGARRPSPVMWSICGGAASFFLWLAWLFGFSTSVRTFLSYQRGELQFTPEAPTEVNASRRPVGWTDADEDELDLPGAPSLVAENSVNENDLVMCRSCGEAMKTFVVVCPGCGKRRA